MASRRDGRGRQDAISQRKRFDPNVHAPKIYEVVPVGGTTHDFNVRVGIKRLLLHDLVSDGVVLSEVVAVYQVNHALLSRDDSQMRVRAFLVGQNHESRG